MKRLILTLLGIGFLIIGIAADQDEYSIPPSYNIGGIAYWNSKHAFGFQRYEIPLQDNYQALTVQFDFNYNFKKDVNFTILKLGNSLQEIRLQINTQNYDNYLIISQSYDKIIEENCGNCLESKTKIRISPALDPSKMHKVVLIIDEDPNNSKIIIDEIAMKIFPENKVSSLKYLKPSLSYGNIDGHTFEDSEQVQIINFQSGSANAAKKYSGSNLKIISLGLAVFLFMQTNLRRRY